MNRRDLMIAAAAASLATIATPALAIPSRITWVGDAASHPQALMVTKALHEMMAAGVMYTTGEAYLDRTIKLTDARFEVRRGGYIWSWINGDMAEGGLVIAAYERGVFLGETFIATSINYEECWQRPKPPEYPDYFLKRWHTPYEEEYTKSERRRIVSSQQLEAQLPKDHFDYDMRWLVQTIKQEGASAA
jgi:hypothetical protein